jgi:hypothetical protein
LVSIAGGRVEFRFLIGIVELEREESLDEQNVDIGIRNVPCCGRADDAMGRSGRSSAKWPTRSPRHSAEGSDGRLSQRDASCWDELDGAKDDT